MRKAIMIVGNYRTWNETKPSFIKQFGDIDTFICSYDLRYNYHPHGWGVTDRNEEIVSENTWIESLSGINVKLANFEQFSKVDEVIRAELSKIKLNIPENAYQSYGQYRKFKIATDMVQQYEQQNNFKYDMLIRTRFDLVYQDEPIAFDIQENEMGYHHGTGPADALPGDQFFFAKRDNMIKMSEFMFNEFYNPIYEDSHLCPPHGILQNALKHNNMTKVNRNAVKHLLRKNGIELLL
jgi:hypothetical protein